MMVGKLLKRSYVFLSFTQMNFFLFNRNNSLRFGNMKNGVRAQLRADNLWYQLMLRAIGCLPN